ncbi:MAG TPA: Gfo/Idh/MocA family oxidoreductase [Methanomicrobiales archaeon]|jgi:predicted dehydrogenase|nr:Gfo/Idh/MocA family oxidoreductase [Methanomicrobiales archaeon]
MDVGVIGVGSMGRNHARIYSELKAVNSLFVYDTNLKAAEEMARLHGATACESMEDLLSRSSAVSLCVPTRFHFQVAQQVIAAGVHVLIEKPICTTSSEGRSLISTIPDDLVIGVGHIERFNPVVPEIRKLIRKPLYVEMKRHNPASARMKGTSVVDDLMIHDIDIALHAFFHCRPTSLVSAGNEDVASALMRWGETPVYLSTSRKSSKKIRMCYIEEEEFTIEGDFMAQEVYVHRKPGRYTFEDDRYVQENIIEKVMVNKLEPLKVELSTFLACADRGKPFPITPAEAVENLAICEEIRRGLS